MNVSFPVRHAWVVVSKPHPACATSGALVPRLTQPRVVAIVATSKVFSDARFPLAVPLEVRRSP